MSSNPSGSVTKRSRRRRRRGNLDDLDNSSIIASVDSSWQEAADAIAAWREVGSGGLGGRRGASASPIARPRGDPSGATHEVESSKELLSSTPPRREGSDRGRPLPPESGSHSSHADAKPQLSPALRSPAASDGTDSSVPLPPIFPIPPARSDTEGPGSAEHRPSGRDRGANVGKAGSGQDGADGFRPPPGLEQPLQQNAAAPSESARGENSEDPDSEAGPGKETGGEAGTRCVLPQPDLDGGRAGGASESDSDEGAGVGRWETRSKNPRGRAGATRNRGVILEDDSEDEENEEEEEGAVMEPAQPAGSSSPPRGGSSAAHVLPAEFTVFLGLEGAAEMAPGVVEEQPSPGGSRRSVGVSREDSDSDDGDHNPSAACSDAAARASAPGGGQKQGGPSITVCSGVVDGKHDSFLEGANTATAAKVEASASAGGAVLIGGGGGCSDGEAYTSAVSGFDCSSSDSGCCSPDAAEEWNMDTGGEVTMGVAADPTSEGENSTGDFGDVDGDTPDGKGNGSKIGHGAAGDGEPCSLAATGSSSRRSAPLCGDSSTEGDGEVRKVRREGTTRGVSGKPSRRRRFVLELESSDSESSSPGEEEEVVVGEGSSFNGAAADKSGGRETRPPQGAGVFHDEVTTAAEVSGVGAEDFCRDASDGTDGRVAREAGGEHGSSGDRSFVISEIEDGLGDNNSGHDITATATLTTPGKGFPRNPPRRRQARWTISDSSDDEESASSGDASTLEQEGFDTALPRNRVHRRYARRIISDISDTEESNSGSTSCLEQEGVDAQARRVISDDEESNGGRTPGLDQDGIDDAPANALAAGKTTGPEAYFLADVSSRSSSPGDDDVDRPRHPRRKPQPVERGAAPATVALPELPEGAHCGGDEALEGPTGVSRVAGKVGGRGGRRGGRAAPARTPASPPSFPSSESWSPVSSKPVGRPCRRTDSKLDRLVPRSSSDDSGSERGGGCCRNLGSPLLSDNSPVTSPVTSGNEKIGVFRSADLALPLSPVSGRKSPRRRQRGQGKRPRSERGTGVGGGGAGRGGRSGGSGYAQGHGRDGGARVGEELRGAAFAQARDSLTAKYFAEFNEGAFGGALSDVRVLWSPRLQSTAGVTKSLRRTSAAGGSTYVSVVELSTKVVDSDTKLRQEISRQWAARRNRGSGGTSEDGAVDVGGGGCPASQSARAGASSGGVGNAAGSKKDDAPSVTDTGRAGSAKMLFPTGLTHQSNDDRLRLVGKGDRLLGLVLRHAPPSYQWAQWLRLPLASAASDGDAAAVEELLEAGADGKAGPRGPDGGTLLHCAARGGSERVVVALLHAGSVPDVNQPILTDNQESPLHIAAKHGHSGASAVLINAGADVDCRDRNGWTPLHLASRFGRIEVVMGLLQEGADRDAEDVNGYRPLHYATMWSHTPTILALIKAGAALEAATRVDGNRPIHIAARYASATTVGELLRHGAEKDSQNLRGFTALHAAAASNKVGAISLLLKAGAKVNLPSGHLELTPLHLAARRGAVDACSALLQGGAAIGARTLDGSTPLHLACTLLKAQAARQLLRHGADELAVNNANQTPADVAGLYLSACDKGGREEQEEGNNRHEEGFKKLLGEIKEGLQRAPADRAWARRGWLIMARARLLRDRRQRGEGNGDHGDGERLLVDDKVHRGGDDDNVDGQLRSSFATAEAAVAASGVDDVVGDKRARRGDGEAADEETQGSGAKRFRGHVVHPENVGDVLGSFGNGVEGPCSIARFGVVGRVTSIKENGIFQNILSFL
eukprot:g13983.t1